MQSGWIGLAVTLVAEAAFIVFRVSAPWRLLLFLPASLAATGFLQAAFRFCANFGMRGVYNFGEKLGVTEIVAEMRFRRKDQIRAQQIIYLSALLGAGVAILAYFVLP